MGKSTKPTKWFKAVKKAFRSPSKERPPTDKKGDADEKLLTKQDFPPISYPQPTPHPLPSFEIAKHNEVELPHHSHGGPPPMPMTPQAVTEPTAINAATHKSKHFNEVEEPEQKHHITRNNIYVVESKHQDDDDDSALSEEEEAASRIQQRFSSPLALKGLIRLQALVRGQLVRRQAATTLRTMEAIVRVQALFRGRRVRMSKDGRALKTRISRIRRRAGVTAHGDARREGFQEMEQEASEAEHEANKRKRRTAYLLTQQLKRSTPNRSSSFIDCDPDQPHEGWAWLELWTNAKAWESTNNSIRQLESEFKDSKDFIEIIPNNSRRMSEYNNLTMTKEVDVNTLKVMSKHHEISNHSALDGALDGTTTTSKAAAFEPAHGNMELEEAAGATQKSGGGENNLTTEISSDVIAIPADNILPPSPQASDIASRVNSSAGEDDMDPSMELLVLPEAANGAIHGGEVGVPNGSTTHSDSFSTSNGHVHQPGAEDIDADVDVDVDVDVAPDVVTIPGHHENGENKFISRKEESPVPASKRATCRYMAATESAKAKFRSSSNPKTRGSGTPEPPESPTPKPRSSIGGGVAVTNVITKAVESPGKTVAFGTRKTTSTAAQNRRSPSPKTGGGPREKPRSVDAGHGGVSPARRNSLGGDDKRWRT